MRRESRGRDIRRSTRTRTEHRAILVVSEGEKTEPDYFNGLARLIRKANVTVHSLSLKVVGVGDDPRRVVEEAIRRKGSSSDDPFDSVWAVVDVDQHATLNEAIAMASRAGVQVAVSNPCFEVWLLMHFENVRAHQSSKDLAGRLSKYGVAGKRLPLAFPYHQRVAAQQRANTTYPEAASNSIGPNPSTAAHLVVEDIAK